MLRSINRNILAKTAPYLVILIAFIIQIAYLTELRATFPQMLTKEPFCGVDAEAHLIRSAGILDGSVPGDVPYFFIPFYPFYLAILRTLRCWRSSCARPRPLTMLRRES